MRTLALGRNGRMASLGIECKHSKNGLQAMALQCNMAGV